MAPFKPAGDCRIVFIGDTHIPEYAVRYTSGQCFGNGRRRMEIHVGYPKGKYILIRRQTVPLVGIGSPTGNNCIKIVFHGPHILVGKAGAFISKPDFAVGGSLDVLVNGYGAVLVGYDTSRHRVLDVGYGTADVGIQRAVFKGTVAVRPNVQFSSTRSCA